MEARQLLATVNWVGGPAGGWDVAANWSNHAVPTAVDDVSIDTADSSTISIQSGDNESVRSLRTAAGDTLSIIGSGTLSVSASSSFPPLSPSTLNGAVSLSGGSLILGGGGGPFSIVLDGGLNLSGGELIVGGAVTLGGVSQWSGGNVEVMSSGTLHLAGSVSDPTGAVKISDNSAVADGLVVSGGNQIVGGINGTNNLLVDAGSQLTAANLNQTDLTIGGTANNPATVAIAASDSYGNDIGEPLLQQGVNGDPMADLIGYGGLTTNASTTTESEFAREPFLFVTNSGDVLAGAEMQRSQQDNTILNYAYRISTDGGQTFGDGYNLPLNQAMPGDAALLASWNSLESGITVTPSLEYGYAQMSESADGTLYCFYLVWPTVGLNGLTVQGVPAAQYGFRYITSTDEVTWSAPTDITSSVQFIGNKYPTVCSAIAAGTGDTIRLTVGSTAGWATNWRVSIPANAFTGPAGAVLNGNTFFVNVIDGTHIDLQASGAYAGGALDGAPIISPVASYVNAVGGGLKRASNGDMLIPVYYRYGPNGVGIPFVGLLKTSDGIHFTPYTVDEKSSVIDNLNGVLEAHLTEIGTTNNFYVSMNSKGAYHASVIWNNTTNSFAAVSQDDGTDGSTLIPFCSTPSPVVSLGGNTLVMVTPAGPGRFRGMAYLSLDGGKTWTAEMPVFTGTFWYSDLCYIDGRILCAYERGHNDTDYDYTKTAGYTIGQIGLTTFNMAALLDPPLEQVILGFDDFPAGTVASTQAALIRDDGPYDARAAYIGSPKYVDVANYGLALEIGNGGSGDAVRLDGGANTTYDPDRFAWDSGSFSLELDISTTEATATRTIIGKYHGISVGGTPDGWKGYSVQLINSGGPNDGKIAFTISDGTNLVTVYTPEPVNDGKMHTIILVRDNVAKTLRAYNADTGLGTYNEVADTTSSAIGTLSGNSNAYGYRLGEFDDNRAGGWSSSHPLTIGLLRFVKQVIGPTGLAPLSIGAKYVPNVAAETFPPPNSNTPDTVAGADLALWLLDQRGGFGSRTGQTLDGVTRDGASPVPLYPAVGQPVSGFISGDASHIASTITEWTANYNVNPIVGGYWSQASTFPGGTYFNTATGSADPLAFTYNLTSAWTIAMKFRIPTDSTSEEILLSDLDPNGNGISIYLNWNGSGNSANIFVRCGNNAGGFAFSTQAYVRGSWYYLAITYDGVGGAGTAGLTSYLIPLTGESVTAASVTAAGAPPNLYSGKSNNVGSAYTTRQLLLGGAYGGATAAGRIPGPQRSDRRQAGIIDGRRRIARE